MEQQITHNPQQITRIQATEAARITTGIPKFDSFLGGGFVNGETIFIAGQPGVGKSTLLLQLSTVLVDNLQRVLYVSGEESLEQLKLRADRLGTLRDSIYCSEEVVIEELIKTADKIEPKFIIIDSLQMMRSTEVKGEQGSTKQMKHCLLALIAYAKRTGRILIVIGHSTKSGLIAGLLTLQHMVDAVFFIKKEGDLRTIQAAKNRFGAVDEEFNMTMSPAGFKDFSRSIEKVKGIQLHENNDLPTLQAQFGDEMKLSKTNIELKIQSGLVRLFVRVSIGFIESLYFNKEYKLDYDLTFKLK